MKIAKLTNDELISEFLADEIKKKAQRKKMKLVLLAFKRRPNRFQHSHHRCMIHEVKFRLLLNERKTEVLIDDSDESVVLHDLGQSFEKRDVGKTRQSVRGSCWQQENKRERRRHSLLCFLFLISDLKSLILDSIHSVSAILT